VRPLCYKLVVEAKLIKKRVIEVVDCDIIETPFVRRAGKIPEEDAVENFRA
jgi:hypothetical protein